MSQGKFLLAWIRKIGIVALVGGLCLVGYGQAQAGKRITPRFTVLSSDPAWVLDATTALRWQKVPSNEPMPWANADAHCSSLGDGSRVPEVKELISLVDYSQVGPPLPPNHPFIGIGGFYYWAATENAGFRSFAWAVVFGNGVVFNFDKFETKLVWCVR